MKLRKILVAVALLGSPLFLSAFADAQAPGDFGGGGDFCLGSMAGCSTGGGPPPSTGGPLCRTGAIPLSIGRVFGQSFPCGPPAARPATPVPVCDLAFLLSTPSALANSLGAPHVLPQAGCGGAGTGGGGTGGGGSGGGGAVPTTVPLLPPTPGEVAGALVGNRAAIGGPSIRIVPNEYPDPTRRGGHVNVQSEFTDTASPLGPVTVPVNVPGRLPAIATVGATDWSWSFGDGGSGSGRTAYHTYETANQRGVDYNVVLNVAYGGTYSSGGSTFGVGFNRPDSEPYHVIHSQGTP